MSSGGRPPRFQHDELNRLDMAALAHGIAVAAPTARIASNDVAPSAVTTDASHDLVLADEADRDPALDEQAPSLRGGVLTRTHGGSLRTPVTGVTLSLPR